MGRRLVEELEVEITRQGLPWRSRWRKGYVAFQRPGGYNVLQVDLWYSRPPRLIVKLPASPAELGIVDPLPTFQGVWIPSYNEFGWHVAPGTAIPDVRGVVDLARAHQPEQGAFKAVTLPVTEDDPTPRATEPSN